MTQPLKKIVSLSWIFSNLQIPKLSNYLGVASTGAGAVNSTESIQSLCLGFFNFCAACILLPYSFSCFRLFLDLSTRLITNSPVDTPLLYSPPLATTSCHIFTVAL